MIQRLDSIVAHGHFANLKYKNVRMPDASEVADENERHATYQNRPIQVYDARQLDPQASFDVQGFQLVEQLTRVDDLLDMTRATTEFYLECSAVVKAVTGVHRHPRHTTSISQRLRKFTRRSCATPSTDTQRQSWELRWNSLGYISFC